MLWDLAISSKVQGEWSMSGSAGTMMEKKKYKKKHTQQHLSSASTQLGSTHSVCVIEGDRARDMHINIHQVKSEEMRC